MRRSVGQNGGNSDWNRSAAEERSEAIEVQPFCAQDRSPSALTQLDAHLGCHAARGRATCRSRVIGGGLVGCEWPMFPRRWLFHALATITSPMTPSFSRAIPCGSLRCCGSACRLESRRLCFSLASIISRPFPHVVRAGLFDVNVFSGLAGEDRRRGVPMVRSRNPNGGDRFVVEDVPEVLGGLGLLPDSFSTCSAAEASRPRRHRRSRRLGPPGFCDSSRTGSSPCRRGRRSRSESVPTCRPPE